jgi:hypothetical protein
MDLGYLPHSWLASGCCIDSLLCLMYLSRRRYPSKLSFHHIFSASLQRLSSSQDSLSTTWEGNLRTKFDKSTSQQDTRSPCQPYVDLTKETDFETLWPMRTLQHLDPDQDAATQQEIREVQWAQDARDLGRRTIFADITQKSSSWWTVWKCT